MAALKINKFTSVLARCLPSDLKNAVKFNVKVMEFDPNLNMVRIKLYSDTFHVTIF